MIRIYKIFFVTIALLFSMQSAHAAAMPSPNIDFGSVGPGSYTGTVTLPDFGNDVAWFQFTLGSAANVSLDTLGSTEFVFGGLIELDTILALYDSSGTVIDQNDDCPPVTLTSTLTSCLSFSGLAAGTYLAGGAEFDTLFAALWEVNPGVLSDGNVKLNINVSAVPVPAAVWLFGTALIGFVGMSRRTSIKS
jgi:hypothetical protein